MNILNTEFETNNIGRNYDQDSSQRGGDIKGKKRQASKG